MNPILLCLGVLSGVPADASPPDEGDLARALPFVTAAVGEDVWTAYRGPEHRGHYRVVLSNYSRDANALDLVVFWQVRNAPEDANRAIVPVNPRVREGTTPDVVDGTTEPDTVGSLAPGQVSAIMRSRYTLSAGAHPENLWLDIGSDPEVARVHLRPHLTTPKKALLPPPAPWEARRSEARSEAVPKFSVLRPGAGGRGCDWYLRDAPQKMRPLGSSTQGCNLIYAALRPDGKKAMLDAMQPWEIDLASGGRKAVKLPNAPGTKAFAGYTDKGELAAVQSKTTITNNVIADPVWYTRYNQRGGKWTQADTLGVHYPICDTFMARRTPMAQDMTCNYLHVAPGYTSFCQPLNLSRDGCNNPAWVPPSDALLALLDPHPPAPGPRAWAHARRFVVMQTPWGDVAATMQTQVSTAPALGQPVLLVKNGKPTVLPDFADVGPVTIAIRGPYLLVGRTDIPRQGPHHFMVQQGPDRVFRLYDLRNGALLDSFEPGLSSVAFWPAGL